MARMPYNMQQPRQVIVVRPRGRRKRRFRWWLVLVPAFLLLAMWVAQGITIGFSWADVQDALHVHNRARYSRLALLGLVAVAVVAIARLLRKGKKDED